MKSILFVYVQGSRRLNFFVGACLLWSGCCCLPRFSPRVAGAFTRGAGSPMGILDVTEYRLGGATFWSGPFRRAESLALLVDEPVAKWLGITKEDISGAYRPPKNRPLLEVGPKLFSKLVDGVNPLGLLGAFSSLLFLVFKECLLILASSS